MVVCFFDVTKLAFMCNHENDSLPKAFTFHNSLTTILKLSWLK